MDRPYEDFKHEGMMKVATDIVVFTVINEDLKVLLIKRRYPPYKGKYALPGGFVRKDEEPWESGLRELKEETGITDVYLAQLRVYGHPDRDPRGRVVSIAFVTLCKPDEALYPDSDAIAAEWHSMNKLPSLAFDHSRIIDDALNQVRLELQTTNIAYQILPDKFTLTRMQLVYEQILGRKLDKRNFRKKIKELNIVRETNETFMEGAHRPAKLYTFRDRTYSPLAEKMHVMLFK